MRGWCNGEVEGWQEHSVQLIVNASSVMILNFTILLL